jgi:hypothetical protein
MDEEKSQAEEKHQKEGQLGLGELWRYLFAGVWCVVEGFQFFFERHDTTEKFSQLLEKTLRFSFWIFLIPLVFYLFLLLPLSWIISLILGFFQFLFGLGEGDEGEGSGGISSLGTLWGIFRTIWCAVSIVAVTFLRYFMWSRMDTDFFAALRTQAPELASRLQETPLISLAKSLWLTCQRTTRLLLLGLLLKVLSLWLPFVGQFVYPVAQVFVVARLLGLPLACALSVSTFLLPHSESYTDSFVHAAFIAWDVSKELLSSYLLRLSQPQVKQLFSCPRSRLLIFGFALPSVLLLSVPLVGPFAWFTLIPSAALLTVHLNQIHHFI